MKEKTVYYTDLLNDEFSGVGERREITVDENYPFSPENIFYKAFKWLLYRIIMRPVAALYAKIKFRQKIVGREKLKSQKGGYYLYGNHTQIPGDGFMPNVMTFPRDTYFIVNRDNVAARGTRTIMTALGALPIPSTRDGLRTFRAVIDQKIAEGSAVVIYPEAHIWPYATLIRPFSNVSFRYPAESGAPVYCFVNTYRRSKWHQPRIVTYIDGPFYSDEATKKARQNDLHRKVLEAMNRRANVPENHAFVHYEPTPGDRGDVRRNLNGEEM